jgi:hypothetical protein
VYVWVKASMARPDPPEYAYIDVWPPDTVHALLVMRDLLSDQMHSPMGGDAVI